MIPLQLKGIFSYFHSRKPTEEEVESVDKIFLTPDQTSWNPYCTSFAENERSMLTHNGKISHPTRRENHQMELDLEPESEVSTLSIQDYETAVDLSASVSSLTFDNWTDGRFVATPRKQRSTDCCLASRAPYSRPCWPRACHNPRSATKKSN